MTTIAMTGAAVAGGASAAEMRVARQILWVIALATAASTVVHHGFPTVLDVPVEAMRAKGVPLMSFRAMFLFDLLAIGLSALCFTHAWRRHGLYLAVAFLGGSFVFTGLEESMWILLGRYSFATPTRGGTYYFTRGFFWFVETPVSACLGWYFIAYSCVYVAQLLLPRTGVVMRAALGGFLAMDVDLWVDPVQTSPAWISWVWEAPDAVNLFGIPLSNFIGWFLLIFLFAIVFERLPGMVRRWGAARATLRFYGILMALEIAILVFFMIYGAVGSALVPTPINLTVWGIGTR